jgi:hypothetical protein
MTFQDSFRNEQIFSMVFKKGHCMIGYLYDIQNAHFRLEIH